MATTLDARPHLVAIKAAIKTQFGPNNAYSYGEVPGADGVTGTLPNIFALVSIERRYTGVLVLSGDDGLTGWRIAVRSLGRTVDEAAWAMFKVATALDGKRLTINGALTPPLEFESDEAPTKDDTRYGGVTYFTF